MPQPAERMFPICYALNFSIFGYAYKIEARNALLVVVAKDVLQFIVYQL
jgi:hypothetical protein